MKLDPRIPLGWMFTLAGFVLTFYGLKTNDTPALFAKSLGINANLWWGIVLLAFGTAMFTLGRWEQRTAERKRLPPPAKSKSNRKR
jgi:hypothetical protein